ncbi:MAG: CarD family transcriptional regulator, partial [Pseudomonadota bacterium]
MRSSQHITVGGAPEGFDARLILDEVARSGAPVLHVARDDKRLAAMQAALAFFAPDMAVMTFPGWDCLPYDRVSPNADISATRMATLAALAHGMPDRYILLTTLNAATQRVPARAVLREAAFTARVGGRIDEDALRGFLVRMGFSQSPTVMEPGDYAIRGGIIDIYPPGEGGPVRLDLFGDVLDGARRFDPATQRTIDKLEVVELAPVSEVILDEAAITRFRQNYRLEFGAAGTDDPLYEAVSAGRKHQGIEHWLPFFHEGLETLFDYLPDATVTLDDQSDPARLARWDSIADQYETRHIAMSQKSRIDSVYKPAPPGLLYLDDAAWTKAIADRRVLQFHALAQASGPGVIDASGRIGRNFAPERQQENVSLFAALADHVKARLQAGPVVIASYSAGARERLTGLIEDEGLAETIEIPSANSVGKSGLYLAVWSLEHGFETPTMTVISEQDVLGDRLIRAPRKRRKAENFLTETQSLSPGDLVVHVDHGIGRYRGLE